MKSSSLKVVLGVVCIMFFTVALIPGDVSAKEKFIKIGLTAPFSGPAAPWGLQSLRSAELLIPEWNKAGGIRIEGEMRKIKLIPYDDKYQGSEGLINAKRLIYEDKVDIIVLQSGDPCLATRPLVNKEKILTYGTAYVAEQPNANEPYIFARYVRYLETVPSCIAWIHKNYRDVKKVARIGRLGKTGKDGTKALEMALPENNMEMVSVDYFEVDTTDFTPLLLKVLKKKPDLLAMNSVFPQHAGLIAKQSRALGYEGMLLHSNGANLSVVIEVAGPEAAEGYISGNEAAPAYIPQEIEVREKYLQKYGGQFPSGLLFNWVGWQTLFGAIKQAGTLETDKVAEVMRTGEFPIIWGKAHFAGEKLYGIKNQIVHPIPISQVRNGKPERIDWAKAIVP
jgi:branched-chain amino acid transport system substrate-binding protein